MDNNRRSSPCRPVALKFRRNIVVPDGTPWGKSMFVYISPVLTRGQTAELPKPAGIGIVFKVGPDGGLIVKSMAEDGPAKLSGKINLEDCLMGVDGRKVFGQTITQVILAPPSQLNYAISKPNRSIHDYMRGPVPAGPARPPPDSTPSVISTRAVECGLFAAAARSVMTRVSC